MAFVHAVVLALSFFSLLLPTCLASHNGPARYDYGSNINSQLRKRQFTQSFVVGGLPRVDGLIPFRPEIRDLERDKDKWNLYLLALSWMQYTDQESPFSFYQIAGIHGAPGLTWGDVDATPGNDLIGYCTHVSTLFPTWHRPYMALYEQALYNIVQFIATLYPPDQLESIQKAAKSFRMPYWDWAVNPPNGTSVLPLSVGGAPNIEVSGPNGVQLISNPLFSYTFKPLNGSTFPDAPYNIWNETKRAPRPTTSPNAISNNSFVAHAFDTHLPIHQQRLYNLFANYPNYTTFSNEAWIPYNDNGTYDSIESLHDSVHTIGGGGFGHLSIIVYSAFDPLFFLHHANVDRIFAMWQLVHSESYVEPMPAIFSSHTTSAGEIQDSQRALTPFFANETSFWTSETVRDHEVFGYTYAEVANKNRTEVIASINRLYTTYSPATMLTKRKRDLLGEDKMPLVDRDLQAWSQLDHPQGKDLAWNHRTSSHPPMSAVFNEDRYYEWIANVRVNKHAMGGSFSVYLFFGTVPDDSSSWPLASNLVGTLGVFANNRPHGSMHDRKIAGTIPLTSALMNMVASRDIASLHVSDIEPFLRSQLELRVALVDGTVVDMQDVGGLCISIASSLVTAPTTERTLAKWGQVESHFDLFA